MTECINSSDVMASVVTDDLYLELNSSSLHVQFKHYGCFVCRSGCYFQRLFETDAFFLSFKKNENDFPFKSNSRTTPPWRAVRARASHRGSALEQSDVQLELMSLISYFCSRMNNSSENELNSPDGEVSYYLLANNNENH